MSHPQSGENFSETLSKIHVSSHRPEAITPKQAQGMLGR